MGQHTEPTAFTDGGKAKRCCAGSLPMTTSPPDAAQVEVYWRPGCPYCSSLRRDLSRRGINATWRNIWEDEQARLIVRRANAGNETVPTVTVGSVTLTNPHGSEVQALLGGATPSTLTTASGPLRRSRRAASWLPTIALLAVGEWASARGHVQSSYVLDAGAAAGWWFTRPLRR